MNCSSCKKPVAVGAAKCPACGADVPSSYSYDLLPEEPETKKEDAGQQYALPPGVVLPPPVAMPAAPGEKPAKAPLRSADRPRGANAMGRGKGGGFKLIAGAGVCLILIVLGMQMCGGPSVKVTGSNKIQQNVTAYPAMPVIRNFEIAGGTAEYEFTVEAKSGDLLVGVPMRSHKERITPEVLKGYNLQTVKKGESKTLSGELGSGTYSFIVATDVKTGVQGAIKASVK